ncbi:MAG: cysteine--tRNA ligase [Candidatus Moranbacteria bacterium]|nr:cysteine--tRNA ligase [Candidatus Moranbacteria bacterium]
MLTLYNTLTNKTEQFQKKDNQDITMYSCGPTVYNYQHIGNYKSFTTADVLRRYLQYKGYTINHVQNITDVGHLTDDDLNQGDSGEDKIENRAKKENKTPEEIARFYEKYHKETSEKLHLLSPTHTPRATEHIKEIITLIETLIENGHAYKKNGNVFFDVTSMKEYGRLSGNTLEKLKSGARLEEHPDKKNAWDFALWLKAPENHIMKWIAPWSKGYPGWHIECSAMSMKYLGEKIDIHTGGEDHIFPHHEAEIAQSECATHQKPFAQFWVHTRHMLVDNQKMSKSKENFFTIEDVEKKGYSPMDMKMNYLLSHYRSQMNFTWQSLSQAQKNRKTIIDTIERMKNTTKINIEEIDTKKYRKSFEDAMDKDLNTPQAITVLLEMIQAINKQLDTQQKPSNEKDILTFINDVSNIFGIPLISEKETYPEIEKIAKERQRAREQKDFNRADQLRKEIEKKGYELKDTLDGFMITKK